MWKIILFLACLIPASAQTWSAEKATEWYKTQPWLLGANYIPANAINQLEMWQADTFDPKTIDKELGWAERIGMNTMRVFLHDLAWKQDKAGFNKRVGEFLAIAARHKIRPMLVFFDSCWDPFPKAGPQRVPTPGVHNSGWLQSPGAILLAAGDSSPYMEFYVKDVTAAFAKDSRILAWDVWNDPDNDNKNSYGPAEPRNKKERVEKLLPLVFEWIRAAKPSQPLTSGVWVGEWSSDDKLSAIARTQLSLSDVISFHSYEKADKFEVRVQSLARYRRPLICTEYLARGAGSTFEGSLPVAKKYNAGMINWGLVVGKTQTNLPWDSWQKAYVYGRQPAVWHHEVFQAGGKPYRAQETELMQKLSGRAR